MSAAAESGPVRTWPRDPAAPLEDPVDTGCAACGLRWRVHRAMAGFRLRCDCGAWLEVPAPASGTAALPGVRRAALLPRGNGAYLRRHASRRLLAPAAATPLATEVTTSHHVRPGGLMEASPELQRHWIDRGVLELVAILAAFLGPALWLQLAVAGPRQALLMPFVGLASGVLVLLVGLGSAHYAFGALRRADILAYLEAAAVALSLATLALFWSSWLERWVGAETELHAMVRTLGAPWALFTIALLPAVFEELAFRGLVLGRSMALLGRGLGIVVAGVAFALAHGVTLGLPFHMGLGLYLGWLRVRSGSLLPGMLTHLLYNATLVLCVGRA